MPFTYKSSSIVLALSRMQVVTLIDAVGDVLHAHYGGVKRQPASRVQLLVVTQAALIKVRDAEVLR